MTRSDQAIGIGVGFEVVMLIVLFGTLQLVLLGFLSQVTMVIDSGTNKQVQKAHWYMQWGSKAGKRKHDTTPKWKEAKP